MASNKNNSADSNLNEAQNRMDLRDGQERLLLMALLMSQEARDENLWRIRVEWFRLESHQMILQAIQKRNDNHLPIDMQLLAADLADTNQLQAVGNVKYILSLGDDYLPSHAVHCSYYAKLVREQWIKRQAKYSAWEITQLVENDQSLKEIVEACEKTLGMVCETVTPQTSFDVRKTLIEAMPEIERRMSGQGLPGLSVGFRDIDKVIKGLRGGQVFVIAATPGVGKSALAVNMASAMAMAGKSVLFFSMEMPPLELMVRMLSAESGTDANDINEGFKGKPASDIEFLRDKIMQAASRIQDLKLFIDPTPHQPMRAIIANAKRTQRKHGLDVMFVDYLQLIHPEDQRIPREQQVAVISRRTKVLAMELNIPIVMIAQANRAHTKRTDKRPQLTDLRESGAIEADADIVGFLYRDEQSPGFCEFIVRKNRSGEQHNGIKLGWIGSQTKFTDYEMMLPTSGNVFGPKTF